MDLATIERAAARLEQLPRDLNIIEQAAFLSLRSLYREYRAGAIEQATAKQEKEAVVKAYNEGSMLYGVFEYDARLRNRFSHLLDEMNKSGCPLCKKAAAVFDGRDRT